MANTWTDEAPATNWITKHKTDKSLPREIIILIKLWCIRNTANRFHFTSWSISVKTFSSDWLELGFLTTSDFTFMGKRVGIWSQMFAWKGDLGGGIWCLVFPMPCEVIWHCHMESRRYPKEESGSLEQLMSGGCVSLLLRTLNLESPSVCMNWAASGCSLCTHKYVSLSN